MDKIDTYRCKDCGKASLPPADNCRACGGSTLEMKPISGQGSLYSCTTIHVAPGDWSGNVPYVVGVVRLDKLLVTASYKPDELAQLPPIGEKVVVSFEDGRHCFTGLGVD